MLSKCEFSCVPTAFFSNPALKLSANKGVAHLEAGYNTQSVSLSEHKLLGQLEEGVGVWREPNSGSCTVVVWRTELELGISLSTFTGLKCFQKVAEYKGIQYRIQQFLVRCSAVSPWEPLESFREKNATKQKFKPAEPEKTKHTAEAQNK